MGHRVTAAAVQVTVGRRVHMLDKGDIVPEGVDSATVERLAARGFIESFEGGEAEGEETPAAELPSKSWNHERLDGWAAEQDPPVVFVPNEDASKALTKEQKLEQIAAELEKRSNQQ